MKRMAPVVLMIALLAGSGCGSDSGEEGRVDPRPKVLADLAVYQEAFLSKDTTAACEQLTGSAKRQIVSDFALLADDGLSC